MKEKEMIEEMCKNFKCCTACQEFGGYEVKGNLIGSKCFVNVKPQTCYIANTVAKVLINAGYCKEPEQIKMKIK